MNHWLLTSDAFAHRVRLEETMGIQAGAGNYWDGFMQNLEGEIFSKAGGVAEIKVSGVLSDSPDPIAFMYMGGNTTYGQIKEALTAANVDPDVETIIMDINSPGGSVLGLFDAMQAISDSAKPVVAKVRGMAASAAYGLASQADRIEATNEGAFFGSIGVMTTMRKDDETITITSSNAPNKVPDLETTEGLEEIRRHLDAIHDQFVGMIAKGRGTTVEDVNANFGRGSVFLAQQAEARGMVNCVSCSKSTIESSTISNEFDTGEHALNLEQLQADHPELYAQAIQKGADQERSRVKAHLTLGESSGSMETAVKAINEGTSVSDDACQAEYLSAKLNSQSLQARVDDDGDKGSEGASLQTQEGGPSEFEAQVIGQLGGLKNG